MDLSSVISLSPVAVVLAALGFGRLIVNLVENQRDRRALRQVLDEKSPEEMRSYAEAIWLTRRRDARPDLGAERTESAPPAELPRPSTPPDRPASVADLRPPGDLASSA